MISELLRDGGSSRRSPSATTRRAATTRWSRRTPRQREDVAAFVRWLRRRGGARGNARRYAGSTREDAMTTPPIRMRAARLRRGSCASRISSPPARACSTRRGPRAPRAVLRGARRARASPSIATQRRSRPCRRAGVETRVLDLEDGAWPLAGERFDAIVVVNYLHRPLFRALLDGAGARRRAAVRDVRRRQRSLRPAVAIPSSCCATANCSRSCAAGWPSSRSSRACVGRRAGGRRAAHCGRRRGVSWPPRAVAVGDGACSVRGIG